MLENIIGLGIVEFFQGVRETAPQFIESVMLFVSSGAVYQYLPIVICAFLLWFYDRREGDVLSMAIISFTIVIQLCKFIIKQPRPWVLDPDIQPSDSALKHAGGYSTPSGHTVTSTTAYGTLALWFGRNWKGFLCIALFLLIGFSRIYLGVHTPFDVVLGLVIGLIGVFATDRIIKWSYKNERNYETVTVGYLLFGVIAAVVLFFITDINKGEVCLSLSMFFGLVIGRALEHYFVGYQIPPISAGMKVGFTVLGLIPVVALLLLMPEIFGDIAGNIIAGLPASLWIVLIYPIIISRVYRRTAC